MSNFSINKIYIFGDMKTLDLLKNKIGTKKKPLIGSKVSKKWIDARIEDLMLEEYNEILYFITDYKIPIFEKLSKNNLYQSCYVYTFYSYSFGDGLGEYFEELSKNFKTLQFVITWLVPDLGYIGREHQINGEIVDQEIIERDKNKSDFRKFLKNSKLWFKDDYDEGYLIPS